MHLELLSPAGDRERLEAAVMFGADAVYLGGKAFGMRSSPLNFDLEELKGAVDFCHKSGVKVYLTCNTLPTNEEAGLFEDYIKEARKAGIDAAIVADIGLLMAAKRAAPGLDIHISTQAGIVNYLTAREFYNLGAKRVILAREMNLADIEILRSKTPPELEIEAFVHGAICMSFSGRCLISQYLTGRDANRGQCAQPCRWGYHLVEEKRPGQYFPVFEDEKGTYILNAQDLSLIEHIDKLYKAGINSFKIEGRAKSAYYVAVVTNAYRMAIDMLKKDPQSFTLPDWLREETLKVSHRQYSTGFYFPQEPAGQYYESSGYVRNWDVIAIVEGYEDGMIVCSERNKFYKGTTAEVLSPGERPVQITIDRIFDKNGEAQNANRPMEIYRIPCGIEFKKGAIIRQKVNNV